MRFVIPRHKEPNPEEKAAEFGRTRSGFFAFDIKDTFRVVVWCVITVFTAGIVYSKRDSDFEKLTITLTNAQAATTAKFESRAKEDEGEIANAFRRLNAFDAELSKKRETDTVIASGIEGIRTELRYMNEKIDVLRQEVAASRKPASRE